MRIPTVIIAVIAVVMVTLGFIQGNNAHIDGLGISVDIFIDVIPLLILAFIVAGMVQVLIPPKLISRLVGTKSGFKGIIIAASVGAIMPGGPFTSLPVAAAFLRSGASIGTMVTFLTSWSIWAINRLPLEIGIMGLEFTLIRLSTTFFIPIAAGLLAQLIYSKVDFKDGILKENS
jgi:uncharacterized membrane protein YraQ (UPF0718 family)